MGFKKYDGSAWQPITPKQLKGIPYTGTLPAVLIGTKAGYLHKYKIYGNTEQTGTPTPDNPIVPSECGERTANLFDIASTSESGYIGDKGSLIPSALVTTYDYIDVTGNTEVSYKAFTLTSGERGTIRIAYYDENKSFLSRYVQTNMALQWTTATLPSGCVYVRLSIDNNLSDIMLTAGSTAPTSYIPYGYKLPLTSAGQSVDIYLGDDTLSTEEYVDSGTGKIYRMVSGVLTPIDPPVPFPQIPTSAGSTTISWAGSGLAPSEFDSIQEWVDIPTYTYTNGAWVADNSN